MRCARWRVKQSLSLPERHSFRSSWAIATPNHDDCYERNGTGQHASSPCPEVIGCVTSLIYRQFRRRWHSLYRDSQSPVTVRLVSHHQTLFLLQKQDFKFKVSFSFSSMWFVFLCLCLCCNIMFNYTFANHRRLALVASWLSGSLSQK